MKSDSEADDKGIAVLWKSLGMQKALIGVRSAVVSSLEHMIATKEVHMHWLGVITSLFFTVCASENDLDCYSVVVQFNCLAPFKISG